MDLPEVKADSGIELPEGEKEKIAAAEKASAEEKSAGRPGTDGAGGTGGGRGGMQMPASGSALVADKDSDGDGKLSQDEIGQPWTNFFDRLDSDKDGFVDATEIDAMIQRMKSGGGRPGGGGPGGGGRPGGGGGPG